MNTPSNTHRGYPAPVRAHSSFARLGSFRFCLGGLTAAFVVLALSLAGTSVASAQIVLDESVSGDFSDSGLTPTIATFQAGSNLVLGTTGRTTAVDRDYFTFTVPTGLVLTAIIELPGTTSGVLSFLGLQAGPQVTVPISATTAAGLLGWDHYNVSRIGNDLFPFLQTPSLGSTGFSGPLGAGDYSVWIQELTPGTFSYGFDFRLASAVAVPEPSAYAVMGGTLLVLLVVRRRFAAAKAG